MMYRGGFFGGHDAGPHVLGFLVLIAFVIVVVALVLFLIRWTRGAQPSVVSVAPGATVGGADPAVAAARMRYARGEMSREDFLRIAEDLGDHPPHVAAGP